MHFVAGLSGCCRIIIVSKCTSFSKSQETVILRTLIEGNELTCESSCSHTALICPPPLNPLFVFSVIGCWGTSIVIEL